MKILLVHNRYQQKGGEDSVVESERNLLANNGVQVEVLEKNNDGIVGIRGKIEASVSVFYSTDGVKRLNQSLTSFMPDVVHVHNWFPSFSPGIFWACRNKGVPVVHTLHNYRLLCVKGTLFRDEGVCEDCIGKTLRLPGIIHGCYRESRLGSAAATAAMLTHWRIGTWHKAVNRFIALSQFARTKLIQGGLPADKIVVKPNFLEVDPGPQPGDGGYFVYVGRLTDEKGLLTLLQCWREGPDLPLLRIVGTGPLEKEVEAAAAAMQNVEWLGLRNPAEVQSIMGHAKALLCPSLWYEGMPRVVVEAMAVGTPVIASRLGTYPEMIDHGKSGMLFEAGNSQDLRACLKEFDSALDPGAMRNAARRQYQTFYGAEKNVKMLTGIYEQVIAENAERP
jgi:glycosyltransferase involved in cell wall biosynthesis